MFLKSNIAFSCTFESETKELIISPTYDESTSHIKTMTQSQVLFQNHNNALLDTYNIIWYSILFIALTDEMAHHAKVTLSTSTRHGYSTFVNRIQYNKRKSCKYTCSY